MAIDNETLDQIPLSNLDLFKITAPLQIGNIETMKIYDSCMISGTDCFAKHFNKGLFSLLFLIISTMILMIGHELMHFFMIVLINKGEFISFNLSIFNSSITVIAPDQIDAISLYFIMIMPSFVYYIPIYLHTKKEIDPVIHIDRNITFDVLRNDYWEYLTYGMFYAGMILLLNDYLIQPILYICNSGISVTTSDFMNAWFYSHYLDLSEAYTLQILLILTSIIYLEKIVVSMLNYPRGD